MTENILCYLKSYTEPGLSLGSVFLAVDPKLTFLSVLGLLLLYVCYLVLAPLSSPLERNHHTQKSQGRVKRRKGGTSQGQRGGWREAEKRRLISILKSPLGPHHDSIRFRQLLCPDPLCEVCNRSTAEVNRLLDQASMEEAAPSVSLLVSTTSMTESSIFQPSTLSSSPPADLTAGPLSEPSSPPASNLPPTLMTPSPDSLSPSPLSDAEAPEPGPPLDSKFPADRFPSSPSSFSRITPRHTQREDDSGLQPGVTFSQVDGPAGLPTSVPAVRDLDQSRVTISQVPLPPAKGPLSSNLAQSELNQELLTHHYSEATFGKTTTANMAESHNLSFLSPDDLVLQGIQSQQKGNVLIQNEKEKTTGSFSKQLSPDFQVSPSGKMSESFAAQQDSASSPPLTSKSKPEQLPMPEQSPYFKTDEDPLQKKVISSLHRESEHPTVPVLGDSSSTSVFNRISKASIAKVAPVIPFYQPQPMPEVPCYPMCQTVPQFESKHLTPAQSQHHFQCPVSYPPPSTVSQIRICGVCFHRPPNEPQSLSPTEIDHLECNILKKEQEKLWGLPSVVQSSQKEFCPPPPKLPLVSYSSKFHVSSSIFPLSSELQKKLEHHLRKRLIQPRWGLPRRVHESLSLMNPQRDTTETSQSKSSYGLSWISLFKSQSSKELGAWGLSCPGSSHGKSSEMFLLGKNQGQGSEDSTNKSSSSESQTFSDNSLVSNSEKDLEIPRVILSENYSRASVVSQKQKEIAKALEVHLSKKFEEISEGHIPDTVHSSQHSIKHGLPLLEHSHSQMTYRDLTPSLRADQSLNTSEHISFIPTSKQDLLEAHIKRFHKNMMHGPPTKVIESFQIFNEKEQLKHSHFHSNFYSSEKLISGIDSHSSIFKHRRESTNAPYRDKVGRTNAVPILDDILHSTSTLGKERQGTLPKPASESSQKLRENIWGAQEGRRAFPPDTHSITDKDRQKAKVLANTHSPQLPTRQAEAKLGTKDKNYNSLNILKKPQGQRPKNSGYFLMSREIFNSKELSSAPQSRCNILKTCGLKGSPVMYRNMCKVENTQTTERPPPEMTDSQDVNSSGLTNHTSAELTYKLENRKHSQDCGYPMEMSFASDNLSSKASLPSTQGVSSGNVTASPVLHVHLGNTTAFVDQPQETWVPNYACLNYYDKFKSAEVRESPLVPKGGEVGGGDAALETSGLRRKSHLPLFPETRGVSKSLSTPSQQRQTLTENLFRKHMKHFLQHICTNIKYKGQERSREEGSSLLSPQKSLLERAVAFSGATKPHKLTAETRKFLEEKQGCRHRIQSICPQKPLSSPVKTGQTQHSTELHVQEKPTQSYRSDYRAPSYKVTGTKSYSRVAASSVLSNPSGTTQIQNQNRQPQRVMTLKDQALCHRRLPSISCGETTPHRNSSAHPSGHQVNQVPSGTFSPSEDSLPTNLSLY
ncbi:spermatogenesis-associated protein 31D4-like [Tupaia chinensis]|uniref:spermatogenesis-associated protein 31D4-like n=1 Tax=Tupaia chinensis TaxID=246437 RepID=UPI0003C8EDF6|nr:spermatogenesis-associated protein 31D4-like [Tupaia chinensis]